MMMLNGQPCDVLPVSDRGLHYGDGVWETVAIREAHPRQLDLHLARLQRGLDALAIKPLDIHQLRSEISEICKAQQQCVLKIIVTRGSGGRGYNPHGCDQPRRILSLHPWPDYPQSYRVHGISMSLCHMRLSQQPRLAGFKHLNRLEQVLARSEVPDWAQEGLVQDTANNVIEATMCNVFIIDQQNNILTPDLQNCGIEGIARSCIIDQLQRMRVDVSIATLSLQDVIKAKGVFLSNSLIGIWPVRRFCDQAYEIPDIVKELQVSLEGVL